MATAALMISLTARASRGELKYFHSFLRRKVTAPRLALRPDVLFHQSLQPSHLPPGSWSAL
jgi:hypothetical protein